MTDASNDQHCMPIRELIPELAMGVASGDVRADALEHLTGCAGCRARLREATAVVDELLLLAPAHEPPPGFESRVLGRLGHGRRRRRTVLLAAAAAVLAAVAGAGVTRWVDDNDRQPVGGGSLRAAELTTDTGSEAGQVFAYLGHPSWLFVTVDGIRSGDYRVQAIDAEGRATDIGYCWVREGKGSWGASVDVSLDTVDRIELAHPDGSIVTAQLLK